MFDSNERTFIWNRYYSSFVCGYADMAADEKERGFISPDNACQYMLDFQKHFQDHVKIFLGNLWFVGIPHDLCLPPPPKTRTRNESHSL